jgi:putative ABC transport system ATP-binding protein
MGIFQRLNYEYGITVIFVTHEPDVAVYTRRIIRIRDGLIAADEVVQDQHFAYIPPTQAGLLAKL